MLLLTDRPTEGRRLRDLVAAVEPCTLVALDRPAAGAAAEHALIICDAALDRPATLAAVLAALARYRASPSVLVLLLDRGGAAAQARAVGATAVLASEATDAQILFTVRRLAEGAHAATPRAGQTPDAVRMGAQDAGAALAEMFSAAQRGRAIPHDSLKRGGEAVIAAVGGERIGAWLDVVRAVDDVTYQHCLLVAGLAAGFSARLGVTPRGQRLIVQAALVHDIGKARVPVGILNKPGRLSPDEAAVMRTHPTVGHGMLARQGGFDPQILDIVRHHHEYLDGTGYPDGLDGDRVSSTVRMVTICDIYSALVERRSYKAPRSPREAMGVLDGMGGKLDRGLFRSFVALVGGA